MKNKQKELIRKISDKDLMRSFYLSQGLIFISGLVLGFFLFESILDLLRLIDFKNYKAIFIGLVSGLIIVGIDLILIKFLPASYYDDGGLNERLFTNRGFFRILWMCLIVSFCEELLFRGVLQTNFGLILTSILFALVHYRYLYNLFLLINVIALSFFIGVIFEWTGNLATTIVMHFVIDFVLGLYINYSNKNDVAIPIESRKE